MSDKKLTLLQRLLINVMDSCNAVIIQKKNRYFLLYPDGNNERLPKRTVLPMIQKCFIEDMQQKMRDSVYCRPGTDERDLIIESLRNERHVWQKDLKEFSDKVTTCQELIFKKIKKSYFESSLFHEECEDNYSWVYFRYLEMDCWLFIGIDDVFIGVIQED